MKGNLEKGDITKKWSNSYNNNNNNNKILAKTPIILKDSVY